MWDLSLKKLPRALWNIKVDEALLLPGSDEESPDDRIEAVGLLQTPQWLPDFFGVDGYADIVSRLRGRLGADQVIEYPYDWRLSNAVTAARFQRKIEPIQDEWREKSGNGRAQLVLVCHSMGGLVARYYCEALGGNERVRSVITIGTPHRGSMRALDALVNGKRFGRFLDLSEEVRSLQSTYELLPMYPCLEHGDALVKLTDDGIELPNVDGENLRRAVRFHQSIREPAEARAAAGDSSSYEQVVFYNRRQRTPLCGALHGNQISLFNHDVAWEGGVRTEKDDFRGDGTVPWFSSLPIEWDDERGAIAFGDKHAAAQSSVTVVDTILNHLSPADVSAKKGMEDDAVIELDVPAIVQVSSSSSSTAIEVQARSERPGRLVVQLSSTETEVAQHRMLQPGGGTVAFGDLAPGAYRVTAGPERPAQDVRPVSDLVLVMPDEPGTLLDRQP